MSSRAVALVGLALAIALAGCVSAPPPTGSVSPTSAPIRVAQLATIGTLDPAIAYSIYEWPWERLVFETLITYDEGTNLIPRLAEQMPTLSADGRTLTFRIREGVSFVTRDGQALREVVATDFVYSLNRLLSPDLTPDVSPVASSFFAAIQGAREVTAGTAEEATGLSAPDPRTLTITLVDPDPTFLNVLAMPFASVVPRELAGTDTSAFSQAPVGTGPYLLREWTPGTSLRFVRNPLYWNGSVGGAPEIDLRLGIDPDTQRQQVQTGALDVMMDPIPSGQFAAVVGDPRWSAFVRRSPQIITNFLAMDTASDGPIGEAAVRQAISHAIDRDNIVRIKNGRALPGRCIFPPLLPGHNPSCNPYPYDVDRARQLLAGAGWEEGFDTTLYTDTAEPDLSVAQAIQQDLLAIGIDAELVPQPFDPTLYQSILDHATPLVVTGWVMDFPDPADFVEPVLSCRSTQGGFNPAWYCSPEIDEMLDEARRESDPARRLALFSTIEQRIMADAPWVPTDYPESVVLVRPEVEGFVLHPVWRFDFERYVVRR